ncbi:AEC family transporter [Sphaerochaeta sp.]|uniref:AEC family transporter n=1 Tax=Sphaerochaeta sp. TaxID=1972642 RepID=UPI003D0FD240
MIASSFVQMLPILLVVLGGYVLSGIYSIKVEDLVKIVSDFFMPALIFISLVQSDLSGSTIADIAKASSLVCILLFALALAWAKLFKQDIRSSVPPLVFMNSGFLGIPLMKLWGGMEAMNLILIYDQVQGIFMFTLGILVITGGLSRKSLLSMLHSPILWAVLVGFGARLVSLRIPVSLGNAFSFAGEAASPLAAFTLGVSIRNIRFSFSWSLIGALVLRFAGGYAIGYVAALAFGLSGMARTVVIVSTALPSAVFTSVLPLRYNLPNQFASTMVLTSTLLGVFTIPLSFALAG